MALARFNTSISYDDHLKNFDGRPTRVKLNTLAARGWIDETNFAEILEVKQRVTDKIAREHCRPLAQHQFALSKLREEGYRIAVCSNAVRQSVDMMLDLSRLARFLEFTLSNEDILNPKPAPDIYRKAMAMLDLAPKDCLIIEDSKTGLQAARASGAAVLQVYDVYDVNYDRLRYGITEYENYRIRV
jgi:HAD superfamily hydrolase (TIGR01509 family)